MAVFSSSLISCFHGILLRSFLNDFEMVPFASILLLNSTKIILIIFINYCVVCVIFVALFYVSLLFGLSAVTPDINKR